MTAGGAAQPKVTYRAKRKLEAFYTGGAVRLTPDGSHLVCACSDEVKITEVATGNVVRTIPGDTEPITALAVSPNGRILITASRSTMCKIWNIQSGECLRQWRAHKLPVADLAVDASGGYVATASADKTVRVWDIEGGFCTHSFSGHEGVVLKVVFHPKELMLYSADHDGHIRAWDLVTKSLVAEMKDHFSAVTCLSLSSDGWHLVSGGRDKVVHVWDLRTYKKVVAVPVFEAVEGLATLSLTCGFPGLPQTPAAAKLKGKAKCIYFATAGEKGIIKIWRSDTGACVYDPKGKSGYAAAGTGEFVDLMLLPDCSSVLCATSDSRLMIFTPESTPDHGPQLVLTRHFIGNHDEVTDLKFLGPRDSPTHVVVSTNSEVFHVYDLASMSCVASAVGHKEVVLCVDAVHLDSGVNVIASGAKDQEVRLWEGGTGRCMAVGEGHVGAVAAVAISRKSKKFMVSAAADKLVKVWDLTPFLGTRSPPSPGGTPVALRTSAATLAHDKEINAVAVAPNDSFIATGSQDKTAKVWRLPNLVPVITLRGHRRGVWCVEFSPVEQCLLTASGDRTIKMWSISDGSCLKTLEGHSATVLRATFATLGTQVLSCGADGLVKLWSLKTLECINTFDEHMDKVWALTTGGKHESMMATGGSDAVVTLWADTTQEDQATAQQEEEDAVQKEQDLENALVDQDYEQAARLAFDLKHPGRLLSVVHRVVGHSRDSGGVLRKLVEHMEPEDLKTCLEYIRQWNTNTRHCHVAHAVLKAVLRQHSSSALAGVPGMKDLLEALVAYSQRHIARVDRLLKSTYLLDYTLAAMKVLLPAGEEEEEKEEMSEDDGDLVVDSAKLISGQNDMMLNEVIANGHGPVNVSGGPALDAANYSDDEDILRPVPLTSVEVGVEGDRAEGGEVGDEGGEEDEDDLPGWGHWGGDGAAEDDRQRSHQEAAGMSGADDGVDEDPTGHASGRKGDRKKKKKMTKSTEGGKGVLAIAGSDDVQMVEHPTFSGSGGTRPGEEFPQSNGVQKPAKPPSLQVHGGGRLVEGLPESTKKRRQEVGATEGVHATEEDVEDPHGGGPHDGGAKRRRKRQEGAEALVSPRTPHLSMLSPSLSTRGLLKSGSGNKDMKSVASSLKSTNKGKKQHRAQDKGEVAAPELVTPSAVTPRTGRSSVRGKKKRAAGDGNVAEAPVTLSPSVAAPELHQGRNGLGRAEEAAGGALEKVTPSQMKERFKTPQRSVMESTTKSGLKRGSISHKKRTGGKAEKGDRG